MGPNKELVTSSGPQIRGASGGGGSADCVCSVKYFTRERRPLLGGSHLPSPPRKRCKYTLKALLGPKTRFPVCSVQGLGQLGPSRPPPLWRPLGPQSGRPWALESRRKADDPGEGLGPFPHR